MVEIRKITDRISYFPAAETPLSADVGVIRCVDALWIFDVGSTEEIAEIVNKMPGQKNVVLSHFHPDHAGNTGRVAWTHLYAGAFTCRRLDMGTTVSDHLYFENGIHIFPLPSSHSKGCVGLEYDDYAFLGDATYSMKKDGKTAYNVGLLKQLIAVLKSLHANRFLLSHSEPFAQPKSEVVTQLEEIYALRSRHDPYIFLQ